MESKKKTFKIFVEKNKTYGFRNFKFIRDWFDN